MGGAVVDYLDSLRAFHELEELGRPPTIREYADVLGITSTPAAYRIGRLIALGWLEDLGHYRGEARSYVVSDSGKRALGLVAVSE